MKNSPILWLGAIVVVVGLMGGSFWGGTYYEQQVRASRIRQFANGGFGQGQGQGQFPGQQNGQGGGSRPQGQRSPTLTGKVDDISSDTITMTTRAGSIKILLSGSTKVTKAADSSKSDIAKGSEIFIQGTRNDSGNVDASKVIIISP